jgi:type VI secretion system protein ImpL
MARSKSTRWYAALAVLLAFILLAWLLGGVLALTDGERVALRVGLVVLGLMAAGALLWFLRPVDEPIDIPAGPGRDDALAAVAAARARLPRGALDAKPIVLVLGSRGSCKTTVVVQSGTDPQLLAGDAPAGKGDAPPPTAGANLWIVRDAVLVEAGAPVLTDANRWRRFVRALRAPRLAAALGRGAAPPRAAVVCVSCDLFYAGGAGEQLEGLARLTRERLSEAARELGVALPVYVLFTKADRIPHFEDWAAPFASDEIRAPIGAALPFDNAATQTGAARSRAVGGYAERMTPQLDAAMAGIVAALAGRRVQLLGRESVPERRLTGYELPREMGKLGAPLSRFLVELCRPMHLGVSPQLRGFYFVGARPVVISDVAAPAAPRVAAAPLGVPDATRVFASAGVVAAQAAPTYSRPSSRRVPQWVFLERLFPEVILADRGAAAAARGGVRVARLRRALLGAGIAAMLVIALGVTRSWLGNRALATRLTTAAAGVAALPVVATPGGAIAFPSVDALGRLETLRATLDTLGEYRAGGVPLGLGLGLWRGDTLYATGRRVWLDGYRRQLHAATWSALVDSLRALPEVPRPTDDYGRDYGMLKAYLVMTNESPRSTPEFLAPVLLTTWARGQALDADMTALARRQFEFFASGLARENPWPQAADAGVVRRARNFLQRFSGAEQIYQSMLAQATKGAPSIRHAEAVPTAAGVIAAPSEVPGAFTATGWAQMENAFRNADPYFEGERWVVGDSTAAQTQDRDAVLAELRARYRADYVDRWRAFVRGTSVVRSSTARDAAQKLGTIGGAQSPLLATLALVTRNTAVDSAMTAGFQPVHTVTPGGSPDKFVSDANQQYVSGLVNLQAALEQVVNQPPVVDTASAVAVAQAAQQALLGPVAQAKVAARQLAQKFAVDTAAVQVAQPVAMLLLSPIEGAEGALRTLAATRAPARRPPVVAGGGGGAAAPSPAPAAGGGAASGAALLNELGRALCMNMTPLLAKYPFTPDASVEAQIPDVAAVFAPGSGALWTFHRERLDPLIEKQGAQWAERPNVPIALSPQFLAFFNRAAAVSAALFGGASEPRVIVTARGVVTQQVTQLTLTHGSYVARFNRDTPPAQFVWPPQSGRDAKLIARVGRRELVIAEATGDWALFRLVAAANRVDASGGSLRAEWSTPATGGVPVAVEFAFTGGYPVLQRGALGGMTCVSQVTR